MPTTNRSFFHTFLAAFRAQSALKSSPTNPTIPNSAGIATQASSHIPTPPPSPPPNSSQSSSTSNSSSTSHNNSTPSSNSSNPRTIPTGKSPTSIAASAAVQAAFSPPGHTHGHTASHHHHSHHHHHHHNPSRTQNSLGTSASPSSRNVNGHSKATSPPQLGGLPGMGVRHRRGSDSSSEGGFRDALGGEKWYIGGRTTTGEEKYYRLGVIKRERSLGSVDRMSL